MFGRPRITLILAITIFSIYWVITRNHGLRAGSSSSGPGLLSSSTAPKGGQIIEAVGQDTKSGSHVVATATTKTSESILLGDDSDVIDDTTEEWKQKEKLWTTLFQQESKALQRYEHLPPF